MDSQHQASSGKLVARIAVAGMSLAVVALGVLAVWAAIATQNGADSLKQAGVQTSGHLRAVQASTAIDTQTDELEEGKTASGVRKIRQAERVLEDALLRMKQGGVPQASRIADQATPVVRRLRPAMERFFDHPSDEVIEDNMDDLLAELQQLLNNYSSDPSLLLATKLESVTVSEHRVRRTAFVLIPLGLGGVAACSWLLSAYRRRSEAAMLAALDLSAQEARTDQLTGLPNRRALLEDLERRVGLGEHFVLALADLNGFKRYNDTFGHPAGDALLRRLGRKLATACEERGIAARLGGDEFCVLISGEPSESHVHDLLSQALCDEGEGFRITAASGMARLPSEAADSSVALRLADTRMYAAKVGAQPSAENAMSLALTRMLDERHPGLGSHVEEVAELSVACGEALGLRADELESVKRAAELHDLGKVAIPSAILTKEGPLNDEEWAFMRRHSIVGERILATIPSLEPVASLVRSSHERWDGAGYPDGLAGEEIPIGARIVFVADAFCAMTEERPYAEARSYANAIGELRKCAGTQFDPAVVDAFLTALRHRKADAVTVGA